MSATVNLRRTLGRVVSLAVPELGCWAAVWLAQTGRIRQVSSPPPQGGSVVEVLTSAGPPPPDGQLLATAEDLAALGAAPDAAAAAVAAGPLQLRVLPLRARAVDMGWLLVAVPGTAADDDSLSVRLDVLARRAANAVTTARIYEERTQLAGTLRASLLPATLPQIPGVELGARYRPAEQTTQIGGDFYSVERRPDGDWTFVLGDVCGQGVDAAVLSGQVRQSVRTAALVTDDPAKLLALVNEAMLATDDTKFVTLVAGVLTPEPERLTLRIGCGGHPAPLILRRDGRVESVEARGTIVGMLRDAKFATGTVTLDRGETLLAFTDGVPEARSGDELLGFDRLAAVLADCVGLHPQAVTERMEQLVLDHLDGRPHDDLALLAIRPSAQHWEW